MERGRIVDELLKIKIGPDNYTDEGWELLLSTIQELCDDEAILTEARLSAVNPTKNVKEIALDAVVRIYAARPDWRIGWEDNGGGSHFLLSCDKIYQWLIKE